jgi:hypothetical protein
MSSARAESTSKTSKAVKLFEIMAVVVRQPGQELNKPEVNVAGAELQEESP